MAWSFDCRFLATKCDSLPQVVWVWDLQTVELNSFLVLLSPVKSISWSPTTNHLLISSGHPRFFVWTQYQVTIFETNQDGSQVGGVQLGLSKVKWHPKGTKIILSDKTHAVIGLPSYDFMQLAQQPTTQSKYEGYLGATPSKLLYTQGNYESSPSFTSKML